MREVDFLTLRRNGIVLRRECAAVYCRRISESLTLLLNNRMLYEEEL